MYAHFPIPEPPFSGKLNEIFIHVLSEIVYQLFLLHETPLSGAFSGKYFQGEALNVPSSVADPGFVKRGGRESKFPARPAQWGGGGGGGGGTPTHFSPGIFWPDIYIIG